MSDDLFSRAVQPKAYIGRNDPETSHAAADKVRPALPSIRVQVLEFALKCGAEGFIDEELVVLAKDESLLDRSYRPRRRELTEQGLVLDTGRRRKNERGNDCVVWIHRDHFKGEPPVRTAPPVTNRKVDRDAPAKARGKHFAEQMLVWAESMKTEGRVAFAEQLQEAAATMRELSR